MVIKEASEIIDELTYQHNKLIDEQITQQLSWLVNRGILVIESERPSIVSELDPITGDRKMAVRQQVKLVSKEKEYIEKLENDIVVLKNTLDCITKFKTKTDESVE
jgi:hypothetical protein